MSQTLSPSLARCYGMARVARVWNLSRASVYRPLKKTPPNTIARRPGPLGACSDAELAEHIRKHIAASLPSRRPPRSTAGNISSAGCPKTGPQYMNHSMEGA
jgi:hypothetical protein